MKQKIYKIAIYSLLFVVILASVIILPDLTMYQERYKLRSQKLPDNYKNYTVLVKLQDDTQVLINVSGRPSTSCLSLIEFLALSQRKEYDKARRGTAFG